MTWRQIHSQPFKHFWSVKEILPVATLEHVGANSEPDGTIAHIYIDGNCYVLCTSKYDNGSGRFYTLATHWFWEAVQIMKELPHPDSVQPPSILAELLNSDKQITAE